MEGITIFDNNIKCRNSSISRRSSTITISNSTINRRVFLTNNREFGMKGTALMNLDSATNVVYTCQMIMEGLLSTIPLGRNGGRRISMIMGQDPMENFGLET